MRLALADVKKTIHRRDGTTYVAPYLLRPRERERELARLIAVFEGALGHPRSTFASDLAAEIVGDYRLARCLVLCLGEWYVWRSLVWAESAMEDEIATLAANGVTNAAQFRLALYDAIRPHGGYLTASARDETLTACARDLGISRSTLDRLLYLDAEENATLSRVADQAPEPRELAARYNQRAFEALLSSAASVELVIPPATGEGQESGRGALVKRVCFLAKRLGVQYDIGFDSARHEAAPVSGEGALKVADAPAAYTANAPRRLDDVGERPLIVTLFGPQELVGGPAQYGERLAAICRALLSYRRAESSKDPLASHSLSGYARIYLHGRPLVFTLDDRVVRLVRGAEREGEPGEASVPGFDSGLERALHEEFATYEQAGEAHGWHLEREPEPIIVADTIMIPDFALTRGLRRVYLEIAGYWRPEYRERKLRKLRALRGAVSLIVAVPAAVKAEYDALAADFPLLGYGSYLGARALLDLMDRTFDDLEQRLASIDFHHLLARVTERQMISEDEALALLRVYSRNERATAMTRLLDAARAAGAAPPEWVDGVGLCDGSWIDTVAAWLRERVAAREGSQLALAALAEDARRSQPPLAAISLAGMESLARRAGLTLARPSLFEIIVTLAGGLEPIDSPVEPPRSAQSAQPRRGVRRTHHKDVYATHSLFEPETANPDSSPPLAPTPKTP